MRRLVVGLTIVAAAGAVAADRADVDVPWSTSTPADEFVPPAEDECAGVSVAVDSYADVATCGLGDGSTTTSVWIWVPPGRKAMEGATPTSTTVNAPPTTSAGAAAQNKGGTVGGASVEGPTYVVPRTTVGG